MLADAVAAAEFVATRMRDGAGRLARIWNEGRASVPAFLDDFASWIEAALDLHRAGAGERWLGAALAAAEDRRRALLRPGRGRSLPDPRGRRAARAPSSLGPRRRDAALDGAGRARTPARGRSRGPRRPAPDRGARDRDARLRLGARAARLPDPGAGRAGRRARLLDRGDRGRCQPSRDPRARRAGAARAGPRRRRRRRRARGGRAARSGAELARRPRPAGRAAHRLDLPRRHLLAADRRRGRARFGALRAALGPPRRSRGGGASRDQRVERAGCLV